MDMKQIIAERIAKAACECFEGCGLCCQDVVVMMEIPPEKKMGDYALPCFPWGMVNLGETSMFGALP